MLETTIQGAGGVVLLVMALGGLFGFWETLLRK